MNLHSPSVSLMMNSSKVLPFFCYCDIRPGSHMPPMHLQGTAWDIAPIREQKWLATLVIPVFTASMPAKLTQVLLHGHAGGKALR